MRILATSLSIAFAVTLQSLYLSCAAKERWESSQKAAELAALSHNPKVAEAEYIRTLTLIPASQANTKVKVQVGLATAQLGLRKYDKAYLTIEAAIKNAQKLRAQRKLDADALELVESLHVECTEKLAALEMGGKRNQLLRKFAPLSFAIYSLFDLRDSRIQRHAHSTARNYIAINADDLAETQIGIVFPFLKKDDSTLDMRISYAALRAKHGHPELLKQLKTELRGLMTESGALERIAYGQLWIADYEACIATLKESMKKLGKPSRQTTIDEARINSTYGVCYVDMGLNQKALPHLRRAYSLLSKVPAANEGELETFRLKLVSTLRAEHLDKEASQVGGGGVYGDYDSWLTDAEKAELAKEKRRRSGSNK